MKNQRQEKILEIISQNDIDTQETLILKLKEDGFAATQTTVSRDINQLKLVKTVTSDGTYKYIQQSAKPDVAKSTMNTSLNKAVLKIELAKNIVVVKTLPGMANAVAVCVDSFENKEVVGSVAGDDTIIIVAYDEMRASILKENLKSAFKLN